MGHRWASITLGAALVLSTGCSAAGVTPKKGAALPAHSPQDQSTVESGQADPQRRVRQYWTAVIANDRQTIAAVARFPFTWDARCRVFSSNEQIHQELDAQLRRQPSLAAQLKIGEVREVDVATPDLPPHEMRSLSKLSDATANCGEEIDPLLAQAATYQRRYFLVDLLVDGARVPTVTRTSLVNDGWFVTGFDN